ncbi:MAG: hypothetical protein CL386_02650 [Acidiferrobacter sp.]|nr:hypothetical protein [Acidiferrobacter sp.]
MDPGFTHERNQPHVLTGRASGKSPLGSDIPEKFDSKFDWLSKLHDRETREDVQFLEQIIGHVLYACGKSQTASMAIALLDQVNSIKSFGSRRKKMVGDRMMSEDDARDYRARVYAGSAVDVLNSDGRVNQSRQIARDWGLNYVDFTGAKRFINTIRRKTLCEPASRAPRSGIIRQELTNNTEFLSQLVGRTVANNVRATAIEILTEQLELLDDDGLVGAGRFTNQTARKAALMAFVEAMAKVKLDRKLVRQLYRLNPVPGGSNFVERSAHLFRYE